MTAKPQRRFLDPETPPHIFTLICLTGFGALAMSVFLPSLPAMTTYFQTEYRLVQLSVALYLVASAFIQLFVGPLADRYGRRPVLIGALVVFVLATVGCLLAPTIEIFLLFRMGQAVMASGFVLARAAVRDQLPEREAASMIGYVTMFMAVVPMIGPLIGGVLETSFGWKASFVLLLTGGLLTLWLVWRDMGETAVRKSASFRAQFADYPELLTARRFWGYAMATAFASGTFFAYLGGGPYVASEVFGLSSKMAGLALGAPALGYAVGNGISGRFSVHFGINPMILAGALIGMMGPLIALLAFMAGAESAAVFFTSTVLVGLGNGLVLPNATSGMLSVRPHLAGTASGLGGAIMIGGGAALSAIAGFALTHGHGAYPLIEIMLASSSLSVVAILYTIQRAARIGGDPA